MQDVSVLRVKWYVNIILQKRASRCRKPENAAVGIRCADHVAPAILKRWH
jgi:hypothetical protein